MSKVRVRFAPSPTGMMHLGNVRAAVINFLFARQKQGTFILRIEDTDAQRMFDPSAEKIKEDLAWLGLTYDEGPDVPGKYGPYYQSQRTALYEQQRALFEQKGLIYRCFCTEDELEKKRIRQQALKLPPRYDRTCLSLSNELISQNLKNDVAYIWRFKLDHTKAITITDLAHGAITFHLQNFSDFAITRQDHSFTFIFANFVDDLLMEITHVFRGEDHLSNTASQAAMFDALDKPLPLYWHLPILCNTEGKKLSKRDFGFSLRDLKDAGYLPEAVCNYVAIIGSSFKEEVMDLATLSSVFNFDHAHSTSHITYDVEKLQWINKKWIMRLSADALLASCRPLLEAAYTPAHTIDDHTLTALVHSIQSDMVTTHDVVQLLHFYFVPPSLTSEDLDACLTSSLRNQIKNIVTNSASLLSQPTDYVAHIKAAAKAGNIPLKEIFWFLRLAMMGHTNGPAIHELIQMLETDQARTRIEKALLLL